MPTRILLIYRFPLVFQALKALMEGEGFRVMGHQDSPEAVRFAQQFQPDIVILDFELPGAGLECVRQILEVSPATRIIVLSKHAEEYRVREAIEIGVRGYVLKTRTADELLRSIEEVSHGRTYFSPEIAHIVADLVLQPFSYRGPSRRVSQLTDRERQVVTLIAEGNSTKEVAARLGISVKTADCHRTRIMDKLNVHQTANLVRYAIRQGFIEA
jgi:two-component system response regulator NreC